MWDIIKVAASFLGGFGKQSLGNQQKQALGPNSFLFPAGDLDSESRRSIESLETQASISEGRRQDDFNRFIGSILNDYEVDKPAFDYLEELFNK